MGRFESTAEKLTETFDSPQNENGRLIASSRERNLNTLSGKRERPDSSLEALRRTDEIRPLKNLDLSENGIKNIRRILQKNGGSLEKAAQNLGAPLYWIKIVVEKYKLG